MRVTEARLLAATAKANLLKQQHEAAIAELSQLQEQYDKQLEERRASAPEGSKWAA